MRWNFLGFALGLSTVGLTAFGAVSYSINNGSAIQLPSDNTINVGVVSGQVLLKVWSDAPTTENTTLPLIIHGSTGTNPELRVLIAGQLIQFPEFRGTPITDPGLNNFAGISFLTTDVPPLPNTALRNASRLVVAINGKVTGPINCGQAFRIQAREGTTADGDITAWGGDGIAGFKAVEVVTTSFGNLLGDIITQPSGDVVTGSIGTVFANWNIGPPPDTGGDWAGLHRD